MKTRFKAKTFLLDGVRVKEIPCERLPFTNMCNFCRLKGTACYARTDVICHADARPDETGVVFVPLRSLRSLRLKNRKSEIVNRKSK